MKIIYCSNVCSEETYKKFFADSKVKPGQQVQKYHRILLEGLANDAEVQVKAISKLSVQGDNCNIRKTKGFIEKWNNAVIQYMPMWNIPKLGHILQIVFSFWYVLREKKKHDTVVMLDVLNISMGIGVVCACRLCGMKLLGIVTDLPEMRAGSRNDAYIRYGQEIIKKCDGYLLLTEAMNEKINPTGKPYVVIEGQVDSNISIESQPIQKEDKKVCLYAGSLKCRDGIAYLVDGFLKADLKDVELHIYGNGEYENELSKICVKNPSVKYLGVKFNDEIVEAEKKATLLINPRPTNQEVVKYSFPSKNMEYMASGTPLLTTRFPGMPKDYYPYVYILDDETSEGVASALREVLEQGDKILYEKGLAAQNFVLKNKTGRIQAKKLLVLAREMLESK